MRLPDNTPANLITYYTPTGSRWICNPAPQNTDEDWLIFIEPIRSYVAFEDWLIADGWIQDGSADPNWVRRDFVSYRKDHWNLIITANIDFFVSMKTATKLAKQFNLLQKKDRIDLFRAVMRGYA